jgi:hypothetical protein
MAGPRKSRLLGRSGVASEREALRNQAACRNEETEPDQQDRNEQKDHQLQNHLGRPPIGREAHSVK